MGSPVLKSMPETNTIGAEVNPEPETFDAGPLLARRIAVTNPVAEFSSATA